MVPSDHNSEWSSPAPVVTVLLAVAGLLALLVSAVVWLANPTERDAILAAGLFVFAGLSWVAAAITYAATMLRKDD